MLTRQIKKLLPASRLVCLNARAMAWGENESMNDYIPVLTEGNISSSIVETQYAVRGAIPIMGQEIQKRINEGD